MIADTEFAGTRSDTIATIADGVHTFDVALYEFPDGSRYPYVSAIEEHDGRRVESNRWPLSEAVHLLINVGELEAWKVIARGEHP